MQKFTIKVQECASAILLIIIIYASFKPLFHWNYNNVTLILNEKFICSSSEFVSCMYSVNLTNTIFSYKFHYLLLSTFGGNLLKVSCNSRNIAIKCERPTSIRSVDFIVMWWMWSWEMFTQKDNFKLITLCNRDNLIFGKNVTKPIMFFITNICIISYRFPLTK